MRILVLGAGFGGLELTTRLADAWREKYDGDWDYDVADGAFQHEAGEALGFEVAPAKVLAFAKGDFAQTRYRFAPRRSQ